MRNPLSLFPSPCLAAVALALLSPTAATQLDFSVPAVEVNQAIQTGTTPLVSGRATMVRATVRLVNPPVEPVMVDGLMRVYVDGVEIPGSPVFSDNGPIVAVPPNPANEDATLNFIVLGPDSSNVEMIVEINPAGPNFVPEGTSVNNFKSTGILSFTERDRPEFAYAPIDYRPSGGPTPNLPDPVLIEPGMGDNFIQAIWPVADVFYHRIDAPSKLWTSSLSSSGSSLNNSLLSDIALMSPVPDQLYGWVPGSLPYNGQALINQPASMGNTQTIRYQRTYAHEVGHNTGLFHNSLETNLVGVDVEHHLNLTEGLPQIKVVTQKDIMFAGLLTQEAWVATGNYNHFFNHPYILPGQDNLEVDDDMFFVAGLWNTHTGQIEIEHAYTVAGGRPNAPVIAGMGPDLVVRITEEGGTERSLPVSARSSLDECPGCAETESDEACEEGAEGGASDSEILSHVVPFSVTVPVTARIESLAIEQVGERPVQPFLRERSDGAPEVAFLTPEQGRLEAGETRISWSASDPDGDSLTYYLRFSPDGGERWVPLVSGGTATEHVIDLGELPALRQGVGVLELIASDGLNSTAVRSDPLHGTVIYNGGVGNLPWVEIVTPDDGYTVLEGANVVLHSSGWDLEDRFITGSSIQWASDVAGPLGEGRLLTTTLSAGTHVITVTATDSDGLVETDSHTITVQGRDLPDTVVEVCQTDLGFGGPGSSVLSLCGEALATGNTADLLLTNAPASTTVYLFLGLANVPVPLLGGTLVPSTWTNLKFFSTDTNGELSIPGIPGGGGPVTGYLQAIVVDGSQPQGFGFSNALELDVLP